MKKITRIATAAALSAMMTVSAFAAVPASADWEKSGSSYSYTDDNGEKVTGWQTIGKYKYYFDKDGKSASGFKKIGGKYYYFIPSKKGRMATGWQTIKGEKYYFGKDGVMCAGKWKTISGNKYYFKTSGKMATGTVKIDGKSYKFGSDGVYIGSGKSSSSSSSSGSAEIGMSKKKVISAAKIKNYNTYKLKDGSTAIVEYPKSYLGVNNCFILYIFDKNDKLTCIAAFSETESAASKWAKKLKKDYKYSMTFDEMIDLLVEELASYGYPMSRDEIIKRLNSQSDSSFDITKINLNMFFDDMTLASGGLGITSYSNDISMCITTDISVLNDLSETLKDIKDVIPQIVADLS